MARKGRKAGSQKECHRHLFLNQSFAIRYQEVQAGIRDAIVIWATGGDAMQIYRMYIEMIAFFILALAVMAIPAMG
jgi:hypothetical protein